MKNIKSLIVSISSLEDLSKITKDTKYINLDISNVNYEIIKYFINNGQNYLYSELIDNNLGYIYVSYKEFSQAEKIIDNIYLNMPSNLNKLAIAKYLYISLGKLVSFDINTSSDKNENYNLSLVSSINNLWGSLALGRVTDISVAKIYYYLCKRMDIDISLYANYNNKEAQNKLKIDNHLLIVDLFSDISYIKARMQTRFFSTYNEDIELDKSINYIKTKYNDYYLDKALKKIDYNSETYLEELLLKTQDIIDIENINPVELSTIYKYLFNTYCPNYDIKINNLYLNNSNQNHFIMISYNNIHYSYNYKQKSFVKVNDIDIINNLKLGKIGLYKNEFIPNIKINLNV